MVKKGWALWLQRASAIAGWPRRYIHSMCRPNTAKAAPTPAVTAAIRGTPAVSSSSAAPAPAGPSGRDGHFSADRYRGIDAAVGNHAGRDGSGFGAAQSPSHRGDRGASRGGGYLPGGGLHAPATSSMGWPEGDSLHSGQEASASDKADAHELARPVKQRAAPPRHTPADPQADHVSETVNFKTGTSGRKLSPSWCAARSRASGAGSRVASRLEEGPDSLALTGIVPSSSRGRRVSLPTRIARP